jgi:plastocyanin
VTARPGKVAVNFDNPSQIPHDVTIAKGSEVLGKTKVISAAKATTSVVLQPGSYTFFCSVPGHRQAGMEGVVSVQAP